MAGLESSFHISPETKIGALLDRFPNLERALLEMAPEFKKLRNPILRKTVAKITLAELEYYINNIRARVCSIKAQLFILWMKSYHI